MHGLTALDTRGLALNDTETALYVLTRSPDSLLILSIEASDPGAPPGVGGALGNNIRVSAIKSVPMPQGPNLVQLISRKALGLGDLAVVTCSLAGTVLIYDTDLGQAIGEIPTVGVEPYGLAIDNRGTAARLYVSDFGDGRVAVIDIPDLSAPQQAVLVAHLGAPQTCDVTPTDASCDGGIVP